MTAGPPSKNVNSRQASGIGGGGLGGGGIGGGLDGGGGLGGGGIGGGLVVRDNPDPRQSLEAIEI